MNRGWMLSVLSISFVGFLTLVTGRSGAAESDGFFDYREEGWHWYKEKPKPEVIEQEAEQNIASPSKPKSDKVITVPAQVGAVPMSTEWLRKKLPELRDKAIDSPTRENVAAYYYAQRMMFDKAQVFSDMAQNVVQNDPLLDENNRIPIAAAAKVAVLRSSQKAKDQIIEELDEKAAIWVFYDEECVHCKKQIPTINKLVDKHNITVEVIHKNGKQVDGLSEQVKVRKADGQFEKLSIKFTPATLLVVPPEGYYILSQGMVSYGTLMDRIITTANQYGLVDQSTYYAANPFQKGVLDASGLEEKRADVDWDKPEEWVGFIRDEIGKLYGNEYQERKNE